MPLKPEVSLTVGLATAVLVFAIYQQATPSLADIRVAEEMDTDLEAAERAATWTSAAVVSGISLIAKDPTVFIIGGGMTVVLAWLTRHADAVNPLTGAVTAAFDADSAQFGEQGGRVVLEPEAA